MKYQDPFFKSLHTMIKNIPILKKLGQTALRNICLELKPIKAYEDKVIIKVKECFKSAFFIYSGEVLVNVVNPETGERIPFLILQHGSCFNFYTAMLGYYSLFEYVALSSWKFLEITQDQFIHLSWTNDDIKSALDEMNSINVVVGMKYDFYVTIRNSTPANSRPPTSSFRAPRRGTFFESNFKFTCKLK